ncbi:SigB/SigF/SigG family RNA polymerase sigma factor [Kribbella sp. NPDC026611]|uniref:SigB/SigF/SigG family RNA polymerase sigma factor n=1 Tax=Kribbella sp. NPDC026611 TaxID=3154911 RepID=UPI0033E1F275
MNNTPHGTPDHQDEETRALLTKRAATADREVRQSLFDQAVELNLGIAYSIATRFHGRGVEADDIDQVASLGLVKAARSYDPATETPFLAYAVPTIRGEVKRYFRDCSWTVRIPRRLQELQASIGATKPKLFQQLHREPTPAELADALDVAADDVVAALAADGCFRALSLDLPLDGAAAESLGESLAADDTSYERFEVAAVLHQALGNLSPRERRIVVLRFVEEQTQADIGAEIGVSQMQVSRLLRDILDRLRSRIDRPLVAAA